MTRDLWTCREFPSHKPLWVNQNGKSWHTPPVFSYEWQIKDLREDEFVRVANKGVSAHAHGERVENKIEEGGYPIPGILQSVRKRLISKELEETVVFKCEASMRKEQEAKELEKTEGVQEAAGAASHILIRDAKAAIRRG